MSLASTVTLWPSVVFTHLILYVLASTVALWPSVVLLVVTLAVSTHLIPYVPGFHCGAVAQCCLHSPYTLCPWLPLWPCGPVLSPLTLYSMPLASTVAQCCLTGCYTGCLHSPYTLCPGIHCSAVAQCCLTGCYTGCLHSPYTLCPGFHCGAVAQCCLTGRYTGCLHSPYTLCPWLPLWRCGPVLSYWSLHWLSPLTLYPMSLASTVALWPSVVLLVVTLAVSTHLIPYVPGFHCGPVAQCCLHSPYTLCPGFHCGAVAQCCLTGCYTGCLHSS